MNSSLLIQLYSICLFCLICMVYMMGGWWPYSCCFVWCCFQDLFKIARNILVLFQFRFFSFFFFFVDLCVVYRYDRIDTAIVWKISRFLLSVTSDIYMIDKLPIASHDCMLTSVLFAFMLGPMPPTARSRLGSRYSARAVIIGRRPWSSASSMSAIISARYCLLIEFFFYTENIFFCYIYEYSKYIV